MSMPELRDVSAIVRSAAQQELLPRFARIHQDFKSDGSIVTQADLGMQRSLQTSLQARWPKVAFLGEEMPAQTQAKILQGSDQGVWIVDPLDGTTNFSLGIPYFAVSVAYMQAGKIELGLVYDPVRDECFTAQRTHGASLNEVPLDLADHANIERMTIGLVDFKRLSPALVVKLAHQAPYKSQRSFGSVALDWCWLAAGRGDVYVHGRQNLWDYAAAQLIFSEAGGFSATLQGEQVFSGDLTPRSAVLAINKQLFERWLGFLQTD